MAALHLAWISVCLPVAYKVTTPCIEKSHLLWICLHFSDPVLSWTSLSPSLAISAKSLQFTISSVTFHDSVLSFPHSSTFKFRLLPSSSDRHGWGQRSSCFGKDGGWGQGDSCYLSFLVLQPVVVVVPGCSCFICRTVSKEVGEVLDTLHGFVLLPLSINVCGQEGACGVLSSRAASRLCHPPRSAPLSLPRALPCACTACLARIS